MHFSRTVEAFEASATPSVIKSHFMFLHIVLDETKSNKRLYSRYSTGVYKIMLLAFPESFIYKLMYTHPYTQ
jgi:hypothetical protein